MIKITQTREVHNKLVLTDIEAVEVTELYLHSLLGEDCYINGKGNLEHWTSWPHGSGTTTDKGEPTSLQKAASRMLEALEETGK